MKYETFEPQDALDGIIKCHWTLKDDDPVQLEKQKIIPDGCMELIFHFGDKYVQYKSDGRSILQPQAFVIGQLTETLEIQPSGRTDIFSTRFHPGGFKPFCTFPIREMNNRAVPLGEIWKKEGDKLQSEMFDATILEQKIQIVESFLLRHLSSRSVVDHVIHDTITTIVSAHGQLPVHQLASEQHINRRSLERRFASEVGLSPKQLSKVVRLQATVNDLFNQKFDKLTDLTYHHGYYDQAHFIRDFKEFTGLTPKKFFSSSLKMSSLFYS